MPRVMCTSLNATEGPHRQILADHGFELIDAPRHLNLFDADVLVALLADCEAILAGSEPYPRRVIESLPRLRAICRTGVGYDAIDLAACDDARVVVTITPGVNHHSVAEHTFALLLGVARGFPELDRKVRENRWNRTARPRVMGSTLGIVGLGRIGQAVATRAVGLGMKVLAHEPYPNQEFVDRWTIELVSLDDLLARSDYVSLHCPAARECRHLMNARTIAKMKPGSVLINTARGTLVDEAALCDALQSGHLRGAGLDVFEVEPLPLSSPLLALDNVLLAGHVAGLDCESHRDTMDMVAHTVVELHGGQWPADRVVNLKDDSGWTWRT
ncbi:MAG TPA: phosphoglycerate dehydrogenase [Planctomycetaceae bacterium]|nr:phosphoglycerate dehydrogenase [Planctomycetaceae bacterium]